MLNWVSRSFIAIVLMIFSMLMCSLAYYALSSGHVAWSATTPSSTELPTETKVEKSENGANSKTSAKKNLTKSETDARIQALEAQVKALQSTQAPQTVGDTRPGTASSAEANDSSQQQNSKFDAVPADQINPLLRRMKIVQELVQKYGRAYDYRVHTVAELEGILAQLKQKRGEATERTQSQKAVKVPTRKSGVVNPGTDIEIGASSDDAFDAELDK
jgi:hypothetical protein